MFDRIGNIDLRQQELHEGLQHMSYGRMIIPQSADDINGNVLQHASSVSGNPTMDVWGVKDGSSPYDHDALNVERVSVDLVNGDVGSVTVLPKYNMGNFQQEQEAFAKAWARIRDIEPRVTTPRAVDTAIGTAALLAGTIDATRDVVESVKVVGLSELRGRTVNPHEIVFGKYTDAIRDAYGRGDDRQAFALASVVPELGRFSGFYKPPEDADVVTFAMGQADWEMYSNNHGTEAKTLQLRALDRIIEIGINRDGEPMTELESRRMKLVYSALRADFSLTRMTVETTIDDIRTFPNNANPRPDLGEPQYGGSRWLMAGSESDNTGIYYPDGSVYLGDMPTYEDTRPITEEIAEQKLHGKFIDGEFVHIGANSVWHPSTKETDRVSLEDEFKKAHGELVGGLIAVGHDTLNINFKQMLQRFVSETGKAPEDVSFKPAERVERGHTHLKMLFDEVMVLAEDDPKMANALLGFAVSGWGSRAETEQQVGLSQSDAPYDFLYMEWSGLLNAFPHHDQSRVRAYFDSLRKKTGALSASLADMTLEKLATDMPHHTQVKEYVEARPKSKPLEETKAEFSDHLALFSTDMLR